MSDRNDDLIVQSEDWDGAAPRVSVVITWPRETTHLGDALLSRLPRRVDAALDTIVVTTAAPERRLTDAFPDVRFIPAGDGASVAHMRTLGTQHALGDIVMLIDDLFEDDGAGNFNAALGGPHLLK